MSLKETKASKDSPSGRKTFKLNSDKEKPFKREETLSGTWLIRGKKRKEEKRRKKGQKAQIYCQYYVGQN